MTIFCYSRLFIAFTAGANSRWRTPILAERARLMNHFGSFYSSVQDIIHRSSLDEPIQNATDYKVFLSESIKQLSFDTKANFDDIHTFIAQNIYEKDVNNMLQLVNILIDSIMLIFSRILEQSSDIYKINVNHMMSSLEQIHSNMIKYQPELSDNLLGWIGRLGSNNPYAFCEKKTSGQITLFSLVKNLMKLEMTTFAATKFYYNQCTNLSDNSYSFLQDNFRLMLDRLESYMKTASRVMKSASNVIYGCDVKDYIRDETYIELEGLVQPIFVSAAHVPRCRAINQYSEIPSCTELIIVMFHTNYFKPSTIDLACDNKSVDVFVSSRQDRPCNGYLSHCAPLKSREVCRNNIYSQPNSLGRYVWYKVDDKVFGTQDVCPNGIKEKFDSLQSVSTYLHHCHCSCHDNGPESQTTHVLNLRWQLSAYEDNKIITGVKFTRSEKILSLQIKQGILGGEGHILPDSENWVELSDMNFFGSDNKRNDSYRDLEFTVLDEGTLFELDEVIADFGYVVTGVKFHVEQKSMKIVVHQTRFDWKTGLLNTSDCIVGMNQNLTRSELPVPLIKPSLSKAPNLPTVTPNLHYVRLKESSRMIDGGSTTILPFFDAQKVEMTPSGPLSGIGLYHKGSSESAGLISLKLIGLNYSYLMTNAN